MKALVVKLIPLWLVIALALPAAQAGHAPDWPDWRGPARNGMSTETGLPSKWSPSGENVAWQVPYGGRSGPVVFGDHLYLQNTSSSGASEQERVMCFNADTGKLLVGAPLQHVRERCAGASSGLVVTGRRSFVGQCLRHQRQWPGDVVVEGRQAAVGTLARRRDGDVDDAWWADVDADHRRQAAHRQRDHVRLGPTRRRRASLHFLRHHDGTDSVGQRARKDDRPTRFTPIPMSPM